MMNSVMVLNISPSSTIKTVPKTAPLILPSPPMMIMAMNSMESHMLNGSG